MNKIPPHVTKIIMKMVYNFQRDPLTGCELVDTEFDSVETLLMKITGPDATPYSNGNFHLKLVFSSSFPQSPPKAFFKTPIFHPNVQQSTGEICVSSLKKDWDPLRASLTNILLCIFSLLHYPNPASALNADAASLLQENYEAFCSRAKSLTNIHARQRCPMKKKKAIMPTKDKKLSSDLDHDSSFPNVLKKKPKHTTLKRLVGKTSKKTSTFAKKKLKRNKKSLRRL